MQPTARRSTHESALVQRIAVVGAVADQVAGEFRIKGIRRGVTSTSFVSCGEALATWHGERKAMAVC